MGTMKGDAILKSRAHRKHTPSRKLFVREGTGARPPPSLPKLPHANKELQRENLATPMWR